MAQRAKKPRSILIVEDNPQDYEAAMRAFAKAGIDNPVVWCEDGDDALDFLHGRGAHESGERELPGVILLDLNLPGTDGRAVLDEVKADPELGSIPVVVLTTSSDERDIDACYKAGANSYLLKPLNLDGLPESVEGLLEYWLKTVVVPAPGDDG